MNYKKDDIIWLYQKSLWMSVNIEMFCKVLLTIITNNINIRDEGVDYLESYSELLDFKEFETYSNSDYGAICIKIFDGDYSLDKKYSKKDIITSLKNILGIKSKFNLNSNLTKISTKNKVYIPVLQSWLRYYVSPVHDVEYNKDTFPVDPNSLKDFYSMDDKDGTIFDLFCKETDKYKGDKLGEGGFGSAFLLKNLDDYFGNKQIVVKEILNTSENNCKLRSVTINKKIKPLTLNNVFLCDTSFQIIGEYFASMILFKQTKSINFIEMFAYKDCKDKQYIFMEKADGVAMKLLNDVSVIIDEEKNTYTRRPALEVKKDLDIILIQMLHILWCMHKIKMNHNDCHLSNFLYVKVTDETTIKGKKLKDYKYIKYDFGKSGKYYIPVSDMKYIIKLSDFGISTKFTEPYIFTSFGEINKLNDYFRPLNDILYIFYNFINTTLWARIKLFIMGVSKLTPDEFIDWIKINEDSLSNSRISEIFENKKYIRDEILSGNDIELISSISYTNKINNKITIDDIVSQNFFKERMKELDFTKKPEALIFEMI